MSPGLDMYLNKNCPHLPLFSHIARDTNWVWGGVKKHEKARYTLKHA